MIISKPRKVYSINRSKPAGKGTAGFGPALFISQPLVYLFASSVIVLFVGMGLFPLLPLYAAEFGASPSMVGVYFAVMSVSNAAGSMFPAWFASRLSRKSQFLAGSGLGLLALLLLSRATAFWQVAVLTSILWFSGGLVLALVGVFTGLYAEGKNRGKSFSLMSLPMPLGALIGGAVIGKLVIWQGYAFMFTVLGVIWSALLLVGLLVLQEGPAKAAQPAPVTAGQPRPEFGSTFYLLLGLTLLSTVAISAGRLGTSLSMQSLSFSASEIASTAMVSGLFTMPLTFLIGALSDRLGRERFLTASYLLAAIGGLILVLATQLWQFWLAATLLLVSLTASSAMASALVTDVTRPEALTRGMSWLKGMASMAGIISFAGTGFLLDNFGSITLYLIAATLPLISAAVLELLDCKPRRILPVPARFRTQFFCM